MFALANLEHAASLARGFAWLQAPLLEPAARPDTSPLSATHILAQCGFGDALALAAVLRAWDALFRIIAPAAVIADYAPSATLAARSAGIPCFQIGSGFSMPPRADPMPALRSWLPCDPQRLAAIDRGVLAAVNEALASGGRVVLERASQLFESQGELLCTFEALDPFGPRPGCEYLGPLDDATSGQPMEWSGTQRPRVLAYLKPRYAHLEALIRALPAFAAESIVAVPGLPEESAARLSGEHVRVVNRPVNFSHVLAGCDLCIGHGGAGFTAHALSRGVPVGLVPMQLEQALIARRVESTGAASALAILGTAPDFVAWGQACVGNGAMRESAVLASRSLEGNSPTAAAKRAAARVSEFLGA